MSQIQCPNSSCGSYKTVSRRAVLLITGFIMIIPFGFLLITIPIGIVTMIAGLGMRDRQCQSCKLIFGGESVWTKKIGNKQR